MSLDNDTITRTDNIIFAQPAYDVGFNFMMHCIQRLDYLVYYNIYICDDSN